MTKKRFPIKPSVLLCYANSMKYPYLTFLIFLFSLVVGCVDEKTQQENLIRSLSSKDLDEINDALLEFSRGEDKSKGAVPAIIPLLNHPDMNVKVNTVYTLRKIGTPSAIGAIKGLVPFWLKMLVDKNHENRWHAVSALGHMGSYARPYVQQLVPALDDPEGQVRNAATFAIQKILDKETLDKIHKGG